MLHHHPKRTERLEGQAQAAHLVTSGALTWPPENGNLPPSTQPASARPSNSTGHDSCRSRKQDRPKGRPCAHEKSYTADSGLEHIKTLFTRDHGASLQPCPSPHGPFPSKASRPGQPGRLHSILWPMPQPASPSPVDHSRGVHLGPLPLPSVHWPSRWDGELSTFGSDSATPQPQARGSSPGSTKQHPDCNLKVTPSSPFKSTYPSRSSSRPPSMEPPKPSSHTPTQQSLPCTWGPGTRLTHFLLPLLFGHATWHVGSYFPDQGSNPRPLPWKHRVG